MKANELMIGDWVEDNPFGVAVVKRIDARDDIVTYYRNYCYTTTSLSNITPVPLTPEILEKNGFERRGCISYHKPNIGLIIHHWNDDLCFLNYSKKNIPPIMIPFHYVHELQQALYLCGLNEFAENFKV